MVEVSDYLIIKSEIARREMIRTLEMNEIKYQEQMRQLKELEKIILSKF